MTTTIVYENSNLSFEGINADKLAKALFSAEARGAEGFIFTTTPDKNSFIGVKEYNISTKNYLYWVVEKDA